jgi:non-specific serine/threonine protein kinase
VREVAALVHPGRVVTLAGPGGVGKTRLAIEVGLTVASDWSDGVWFVDLAPLRENGQIGPAVADAVAVSRHQTGGDWRTVLDDLRDRHALLILDNCEHLLDAVAQFADDLLAVCPAIGLLATSRERLGCSGERLKVVAPLGVPAAGAPREEMLREPAVRLFLDRVTAVRPDLRMTDAEVDDVAAICRRLDGLPLALELAAGQAPVLSIAEVLARLDNRFALLRSRQRRGPDRQRTMEAVLDWGYALLRADEQLALRRLGLFRSGFTLETASAAIADEATDAFEVPELVWALADKSFVVAELAADETRYRLLETVRAYASRLLSVHDDPARVAARLGRWWLERIGPEQPIDRKHTGRIAAELDNLLGLVDLLVHDDPLLAQELACTIGRYYYAVETLDDSVDQLERFVAALPEPSHALSSLLATLAHLYVRRGDVDAARDAAHRARKVQDAVGGPPPWDEVAVERSEGEVALRSGDYAAAREIATGALERVRDPRARVRMCNLLGVACHFAGDASSGDAAFADELRLAHGLGDEHLAAIAESNVAEAALRRGDTHAAARHQLAGLRLAVALGAPASVAYSLIAAARLVAARDPRTATSLHVKAEDVLGESGHVLYDDDRRASDEMLQAVRESVGSRGFDDACAEGRALTLVDAAAMAERVLARIAAA